MTDLFAVDIVIKPLVIVRAVLKMVDTVWDLVLRWLALGVFTPLMRNHTALGTREQEC